jgi:hypothetical protein
MSQSWLSSSYSSLILIFMTRIIHDYEKFVQMNIRMSELYSSMYDLKLSRRLNAIKSSQATGRVNSEQESNVSETFFVSNIPWPFPDPILHHQGMKKTEKVSATLDTYFELMRLVAREDFIVYSSNL